MQLMKSVYRFVDRHLGVFYMVNLGMITALMTMSFQPQIILVFILSWLITGNHWRKSRDVHLENGYLKLKKLYHKRSLNPIKRVDDIISNNKNGKIVISLIESSKFKINGVIKTPESLGFVDTKLMTTKNHFIVFALFRFLLFHIRVYYDVRAGLLVPHKGSL